MKHSIAATIEERPTDDGGGYDIFLELNGWNHSGYDHRVTKAAATRCAQGWVSLVAREAGKLAGRAWRAAQ